MAKIQPRPCKITVAEAIIRPTGLLDPEIIVKPVANQVDDILEQVRQRVAKGQRVIITTLTKKFAEELDEYLKNINVKSAYIHSDIDTLDRLDIIADLRRGKYDVLIGVNLLREGLDLPEVSLVAIFDADKEGFLRSKTSLIQMIGRAARHVEGTVIMYADTITESMRWAIEETNRRRALQMLYNQQHGIVPTSTQRSISNIAEQVRQEMAQEKLVENKVTYTPFGFQPATLPEDPWDEVIASRFSNQNGRSRRRGQKKTTATTWRNTQQIYQDFESLKQQNLEYLRSLKLTPQELKDRLQIAIDAMDFEMAAAIRDLLVELENFTVSEVQARKTET